MRARLRTIPGRTLLLTLLLTCCAPAAEAPAATVSCPGGAACSGKVLIYTAAAGETNQAVVTNPSGSTYRVTESGPGTSLTAGTNCTQVSATVVECSRSGIGLTATLLDGNDSFSSAGITNLDTPVAINGGVGSDVLTAPASGSPTLIGDAGADTLYGGGAADTLNGQADNDILVSGAGNDAMDGGLGIDRADWTASAAGITGTLNLAAAAVFSGQGTDTVSNVEALSGSNTAGDNFTGDANNNAFAGQGGIDVVRGGGGNDFMTGGAGADDLAGGTGIDRVSYTGNSAGQVVAITLDGIANDSDGNGAATAENVRADVEYLFGTPGADSFNASANGAVAVALWGRGGDDTLTGSSLDDFIDGQAGADTVDCGGGSNDLFYSDLGQPGGDSALTNCETQASSAPKETP